MKRVFATTALVGAVLLGLGGVAVADPTGPVTQPGLHHQECDNLSTVPGGGQSSLSPGSPFQEGISGGRYAGAQEQNSGNQQESQYDVACFQVSAH